MFLPTDGLVASLVPAIDTVQYASGDVMGAPMEIASAALNTKGLSYLRTLLVLDAINQKAAIDVLLFDRDPGSIGANNAALDLNTTQLGYLIALYSVAGADYVTLKANTNAAATKAPGLLLPTKQGSKAIWAAFVSRGTPTYTSTDLTFKFVLERQ